MKLLRLAVGKLFFISGSVLEAVGELLKTESDEAIQTEDGEDIYTES